MMTQVSSQHGSSPGLAARLRDATGEHAAACYQCGKCTAGCPLADEMDIKPNQIFRLLQTHAAADDEEVLGSLAIWLCLACETCATRCPQEVSLAATMDFLRQEALARGLAHPRAKDILAFHESFLAAVRANGRLHEVGLVASYKLKTMHLFQDVLIAPKLFARGKLSILPHKIKGQAAVEKIFVKAQQANAKAREKNIAAAAAHEHHGEGHA
jgi:heterodisulfide reductase subunit C2